MTAPLPSLRVQVVRKDNPVGQLARLSCGLAAAVHSAREAQAVGTCEAALGDCSEVALAGDQRAHLAAILAEEEVALAYEFFGANLGHSGGHNRLAERADADLLLLINPDAYPAPSMLTALVAALTPGVGIAEARQLPCEHPKDFDPGTGDTSWASGCCMLLTRSVFEAVGGFAPEFFPLQCDDVDLSWRVRLAGHRVVHVPEARVFHDKRPDLGGFLPPSDSETYHSALGRLMLGVRYSNPVVLAETARHIESDGSEAQRSALREFRRREAEGSVPPPLPGAEAVAQFLRGEYARHRF